HQVELEMQNEHLRQAQVALEASLERYRALYEQAPVGYITVSLAGLIVETNQMAAQMLGGIRSHLLQERLANQFASADRPRFQAACAKALQDTAVQIVELQLVGRRSAELTVSAHVAVVRDNVDDARRNLRVALVDISDRARLLEERAHLAAIV